MLFRSGKIISFSLLLFVFAYSVVLFYDIINFISSEYLYKTPSYIIGAMILVPIIYLLTKGLRTISRVSIILFMISIVLYVFSIAGLIPSFDSTNLLPFLEEGLKNPLIGALGFISYTAMPIFILLIIPREDVGEKKIGKKQRKRKERREERKKRGRKGVEQKEGGKQGWRMKGKGDSRG